MGRQATRSLTLWEVASVITERMSNVQHDLYVIAYVLNMLMLLVIAISTTWHAWTIWGRWRPHDDARWKLDWSVSMFFWALAMNEIVRLPYQLSINNANELSQASLVSAVVIVVIGLMVNHFMLTEAEDRSRRK